MVSEKFLDSALLTRSEYQNDGLLTQRVLISVGLVLLVLLQYAVLQGVTAESEKAAFIPPAYLLVLWMIPAAVLVFINNVYSRIVCSLWVIWYVIGGLNILASYYTLGHEYYIDVERAAIIYMAFTTAFFCGILTHEVIVSLSKFPSLHIPVRFDVQKIHPAISMILIGFPFLWFASFVRAVGYVPILSGGDVNSQIYNLSYGPLYGYGIINVLSLFYVSGKCRQSTSAIQRLCYAALAAFYIVAMIADGKRYTLMVALAAGMFLVLKVVNGKRARSNIAALLTIAIIFYVVVLVVRVDLNDTSRYGGAWMVPFAAVGVEYRDFVYSVNNFPVDSIVGYDLAASTLVNFLNGGIAALLQIDKNSIVKMGSAYVWQDLFKSDFGIRTGIVSEVYFAYQYWGILLIWGFGLLTAIVSRMLSQAIDTISVMFRCVIAAVLLLTIMGQSDVLSGVLTVLFYMWILVSIVRFAGVSKY